MAKACGRIRKVVTLDEWFWKSYISWSDDCSLCGQSLSCVLWFGVFVLFCFLHFYVILHNKKTLKSICYVNKCSLNLHHSYLLWPLLSTNTHTLVLKKSNHFFDLAFFSRFCFIFLHSFDTMAL